MKTVLALFLMSGMLLTGWSQSKPSAVTTHPGAADQSTKSNDRVAPLIAGLQQDDWHAKVNAALQLRSFRADGVPAIPALLNNLGDTRDGAPQGYYWSPAVYNPQSAAVEALTAIVPYSKGWGLDYAQKVLANGNSQARESLAEVLPAWGENAIPLMIAILKTEDDYRTLQTVERGLGSLGHPATLALTGVLDASPSHDLRRHALEAIIDGSDPQSLPILLYAYQHNNDDWLKADLQKGICLVATENELGLLESFLHDSNTFTGEYAVEALVRIRSPRAIDALSNAIHDQSTPELTRAHAVGAYQRVGAADGTQAVLTASTSPEKYVRLNAIQAMATPSARFEKPLLAALDDPDPQVRLAAIESLKKQKIDKREMFDTMLKRLDDNDERVKNRAADVLTSLTGRQYGTDLARWNTWLETYGRDFNWNK